MGDFLKSSWLVLAAALVFGLLLAIVYVNWQPRIEENERLKLERGIYSILTNATSTKADTLMIEGEETTEPLVLYTGLDSTGTPVGLVFTAEGTGFQDKIKLLVGVDLEFEHYKGIAVIAAAETPGFGDAIRDYDIFRCQFVGTPVDPPLKVVKTGDRRKTDDNEIVSITGATITSRSVTNLINARVRKIREAVRHHVRERMRGSHGA